MRLYAIPGTYLTVCGNCLIVLCFHLYNSNTNQPKQIPIAVGLALIGRLYYTPLTGMSL